MEAFCNGSLMRPDLLSIYKSVNGPIHINWVCAEFSYFGEYRGTQETA